MQVGRRYIVRLPGLRVPRTVTVTSERDTHRGREVWLREVAGGQWYLAADVEVVREKAKEMMR